MNDWYYQGKPFKIAPEDMYGFIYLLTNIKTGQKYIGKKSFWSKRSKKVKGLKNRKHFVKASDWLNYWSSSEDLKEHFDQYGTKDFKREILKLCPTKSIWTYSEIEYQILNDVLRKKLKNGEYEYYNRNIASKFFRKTFL